MTNLTANPKQNMPATSIIFLPLPLSLYSNQLSDELINNYKNDWQITKIIESQNFYDDKALTELITEVKISKDFPVNILIDEELLNNPYYSLTWSVLGVLSIAGLIYCN